MPKPPKNQPNALPDPQESALTPQGQGHIPGWRTWERWLIGAEFGVVILAAIATVYFISTFPKVAPSGEEVLEWVVLLVGTAILLFVLGFLRSVINSPAWSHQWYVKVAVPVVVLVSLLVVGSGASVFISYSLRWAGILPPKAHTPVLLRPASTAEEYEYDAGSTLDRADGGNLVYSFVEDRGNTGKLKGIYVEFGPADGDIEAVLVLPYQMPRKTHRVRLSRSTKTFALTQP